MSELSRLNKVRPTIRLDREFHKELLEIIKNDSEIETFQSLVENFLHDYVANKKEVIK